MPHYFFDILEDGQVFADSVGVDLSGDEAAVKEATNIAAELARDHLASQPRNANIEVRARGSDGRSVFVKSVQMQVDGADLSPPA